MTRRVVTTGDIAVTDRPFLECGRSNAFAHRGDRAAHPPGNRWAALESAVQLGFDHIETDVHLSADGELVMFHDDRLDDETTGSGELGEHAWSDLSELRYRAQGDVLDEGLVRFEDALRRWPHVAWNVDCKHDHAIEPLLRLVERADAADRVLVTSFSFRTLRRIRRDAPPGLCTGLSKPEIALTRVASWLRLPTLRLGDAAQVPAAHEGLTVVDAAFVRTCHRAGTAVHVWTVNEPDEMHRLLDLGVDGIITDDPATLRTVLEQRNAW